jgi:DNA-binding LacI/PurR family transcriptional regulator
MRQSGHRLREATSFGQNQQDPAMNDPGQPHLAVMQRLLEEARERGLERGRRLPAVRELARRYRVGKGTVQLAFRELVREGFCRVVDRKGLFLAKEPPAAEPQSTTMGIVLAYERYNQEDNPFYRSLFEGAEREAAGRGHNLLSLCGWKRKSALQKSRELEQFRGRLAGFVALGLYDERDCLRLRDAGAPVVAVDYETRDLGIDCVVIDNRAVMSALSARALAARPAEIFLVDLARPSDYDPAIVERRRAFEQALAAAGRKAGPENLVYLGRPGGDAGAVEPLRRAAGRGRRRPAAVCMDEFTARALLRALGPAGPRPGRDFLLAYLGFLRPQYPDLAALPAVIGAVDFRELGREGVRLLEERVERGPGRAVRRTVGGQVVEWPGANASPG